jgi:hypothetical protein
MPLQDIYVVLTRDRGLQIVEPVPGETASETIEAALGLKGGYSSGLVEAELAEGAREAWAAWVEGATTAGQPYFEFRCFDAILSEGEVESILREARQEALRLVRARVWRAADREEEGGPA